MIHTERPLEEEVMTRRSAPPPDETRARLLEAANVIFSELGFQGGTTRMICERAQANPAAVNYHFGDKLGLYTEVLKSKFSAHEQLINGQQLLEMEPEAALGEFISRFFSGLVSLDGAQQHMRIMGHELSQPTPALTAVVEQIIRPQAKILCELISRITGSRPDSVATALAAQSILGQMTQYMNARPILNLLWSKWPSGAGSNDEIIAHIIKFSLAGLRALQEQAPKAIKRGRQR